MPGKQRKKTRKRTKYSKIIIKLTARQKKSLMNYCRARQTTPNRLIKKSIRRFINGFDRIVPAEYFITETQLDLFEEPTEEAEAEGKGNPIFTNQKGGKKGIPVFDLFSGGNSGIKQ